MYFEMNKKFMQLALQLARKGCGKTSPNPMVGAVVVKRNQIIANGYHGKFGGPHAEAVALHACGNRAKGATLYVNLEPCCHYGKTPPCTDLIIQSGIKKVVCSTIDPNPQVNGKGIESLKKEGIEVSVGTLAYETKKLNEVYFKYITTKLPFVALKVIGTLDGKIVQPNRLTKLQQKMTSTVYEDSVPSSTDAILLDAGMVNHSNLRREDLGKFKLILIGDWKEILSKLKTIGHRNVVLAPIDRKIVEVKRAVEIKVWEVKKRKDGGLDLLWLLKKAGEEGISSLLVKGGNRILTAFLKQKLVDKIWYQIFPDISGKGEEPFGDLGIRRISEAIVLKSCEWKQSANSLLVSGYPTFL